MISFHCDSHRARSGLLLLVVIPLAAGLVMAADIGSSNPADSSKADALSTARAHMAAKRWNEAAAALKTVDDTGNADWNNLMGYAARRSATPDFEAAERYYDAALQIDPRHRGALEYSGELYLIKGDLPRAEQRLQTLRSVCTTPCEEMQDLEKAVAQFKADGKYRPTN